MAFVLLFYPLNQKTGLIDIAAGFPRQQVYGNIPSHNGDMHLPKHDQKYIHQKNVILYI